MSWGVVRVERAKGYADGSFEQQESEQREEVFEIAIGCSNPGLRISTDRIRAERVAESAIIGFSGGVPRGEAPRIRSEQHFLDQ